MVSQKIKPKTLVEEKKDMFKPFGNTLVRLKATTVKRTQGGILNPTTGKRTHDDILKQDFVIDYVSEESSLKDSLGKKVLFESYGSNKVFGKCEKELEDGSIVDECFIIIDQSQIKGIEE